MLRNLYFCVLFAFEINICLKIDVATVFLKVTVIFLYEDDDKIKHFFRKNAFDLIFFL